MPKTTVGEPGGLDVLVTLRLLRDASVRGRIARALVGDLIDAAVASGVSVRVVDSSGWDQMAGSASPLDRAWSEWRDDADDALEAYRKNFLVRRIVNLTRSYVVGNGITISSSIPEVETFAREFWSHHQNRMVRRLGPMCDELTRVGEVFPEPDERLRSQRHQFVLTRGGMCRRRIGRHFTHGSGGSEFV